MSSTLNPQVTPTTTSAVALAETNVTALQQEDKTTAIYILAGIVFFWFFMKK